MRAEDPSQILRKARSGGEGNLWLSALIAKESAVDVVIMGGSAIESCTRGLYVSNLRSW